VSSSNLDIGTAATCRDLEGAQNRRQAVSEVASQRCSAKSASEGYVCAGSSGKTRGQDTRVRPSGNHALRAVAGYEGGAVRKEPPQVGVIAAGEGVKGVLFAASAWRVSPVILRSASWLCMSSTMEHVSASLTRVAVPGRCSHPRRKFLRLLAVRS